MRLVKFTNPKHVNDAIERGSILLGSVRHYHQITGAGQDPLEGLPSALGDYDNQTKVSAKDFNEIAEAVGSPFRLEDGWTIEQPQGAHLILGPFFNTLIFSCSMADPSSKRLHKFGEGYYFIDNPKAFAHIVREAIFTKLTELKQDNKLSFDVSSIECNFFYGPVEYVEEKTPIAISEANQIEKRLDVKSLFQKTKQFEHEQEYRFVFLLRDPFNKGVWNLGFNRLPVISAKLPTTLSR